MILIVSKVVHQTIVWNEFNVFSHVHTFFAVLSFGIASTTGAHVARVGGGREYVILAFNTVQMRLFPNFGLEVRLEIS